MTIKQKSFKTKTTKFFIMPRKAKKKNEDKNSRIRKIVFTFLALVLVAVMGRIVFEAYSFISYNTGIADQDIKITGMAYTISGGDCVKGEDSTDCCERACTTWCVAKGESLYKVGVLDPINVRCKCTCLE
jgi:hypothetical protein